MNAYRVLAMLLLVLVLAPSSESQGQSKDQLGKVDFANSCSPAVQERLQRSVAMLHSFWYTEAEKSFREVLVQDPSCGIATWGIASILMSNPLAGVGPSPEGAARAQAAVDQGRKVGAKTQRERDYIEAVAAYYEDWGNRPERVRQANRAKAFEALAARYPTDDEAQVFYALYLAGTQSQADQSYATYLKAAGVLEAQFAKHPEHPGVAHYLIHSYDAPPIAPKGLPAARRYAGIAPSAPHALHMPSHIFTRVGAWSESAATNERSAAAARRDRDFDEALHAIDYMVYAYLQLARDADARRVMEESATAAGVATLRFAGPYAQAAMPARYAVERGDWKQAAALTPNPSQWAFTVAITHYARALGAARSGDPAAAERDVQELVRLRDALKAAKSKYWATEVEVQPHERRGVDGAGPRQARRGAHPHARRRGHRGQEREAHRDAGTHRARARGARRHAARGEAPRGCPEGVRGLAGARARALPRLLRRRPGRRPGGRQGEGAALLREARGDGGAGLGASGAGTGPRLPRRQSLSCGECLCCGECLLTPKHAGDSIGGSDPRCPLQLGGRMRRRVVGPSFIGPLRGGEHPRRTLRWLALVLLVCGGLLPLLALASPPDPVWIPGIYDVADLDDVVDVLTDIAAVEGSPPATFGPRPGFSALLSSPASVLASSSPLASRPRSPPIA